MIRDPLVEEIRRIRKALDAECNNDARAFFEHVQEFQKKYASRLGRRQPKPGLGTNKP